MPTKNDQGCVSNVSIHTPACHEVSVQVHIVGGRFCGERGSKPCTDVEKQQELHHVAQFVHHFLVISQLASKQEHLHVVKDLQDRRNTRAM